MTRIMHSAAEVVPMLPLLKKKSGTPTSAADPKHTSCRFVRPNSILLLIFVRSFGTVTYANGSHPFRKPDIACNLISPHIPAGR